MRGGRVPFIEHLLVCLRVPYAAMLLPAAWMFAASRHDILRAFPVSRMIPISPRIDWDGRGAPAVDHAWHVWDACQSGPTVLILPEARG